MRSGGFKVLRYPLTKGVKGTVKTEKDRPESIFPVMSLPLNAAVNIETGLRYNDVQVNYEKCYRDLLCIGESVLPKGTVHFKP